MIETEIKVKIENPEEIKKKISELNGIYKLSLHHEDIYFNMPDGLRDFQITDEALRIRSSKEYNNNFKENSTKVSNYITYKGKKLDKLTKTRNEIEVQIDDNSSMKEILLALGFKEVLTIVKERALYEIPFKDRIIEVLIDYIPVLAKNFMELELIVESTQVSNARMILFSLLEEFGFKETDSIRKSYLELIIEKS